MRTISLNCSFLIIFNNLRKQIKFLGSQLFLGESKMFEEILNDAFKTQDRAFLIVYLLPDTIQELRLRTFVFKNNKVYVYIKNSNIVHCF